MLFELKVYLAMKSALCAKYSLCTESALYCGICNKLHFKLISPCTKSAWTLHFRAWASLMRSLRWMRSTKPKYLLQQQNKTYDRRLSWTMHRAFFPPAGVQVFPVGILQIPQEILTKTLIIEQILGFLVNYNKKFTQNRYKINMEYV